MRTDWNPALLSSSVIVVSDRIASGEREDTTSPVCVEAITSLGMPSPSVTIVTEGLAQIASAIEEALSRGDRFILTLGGSGFREGNDAPEAARRFIEVELPGIAEMIRAHGAKNTLYAPLSRQVAGVSARNSSGAFIVTSPSSKGGAKDTLEVVLPLLPQIISQLNEAEPSR